jgi:hypothetical protein
MTVAERLQAIDELLERKKGLTQSQAKELREHVTALADSPEGRLSIQQKVAQGNFKNRGRFLSEVVRAYANPAPALAALTPAERHKLQLQLAEVTRPASEEAHWRLLALLLETGSVSVGGRVEEALRKCTTGKDDLRVLLPQLPWGRLPRERGIALLEAARKHTRDQEPCRRLEQAIEALRPRSPAPPPSGPTDKALRPIEVRESPAPQTSPPATARLPSPPTELPSVPPVVAQSAGPAQSATTPRAESALPGGVASLDGCLAEAAQALTACNDPQENAVVLAGFLIRVARALTAWDDVQKERMRGVERELAARVLLLGYDEVIVRERRVEQVGGEAQHFGAAAGVSGAQGGARGDTLGRRLAGLLHPRLQAAQQEDLRIPQKWRCYWLSSPTISPTLPGGRPTPSPR